MKLLPDNMTSQPIVPMTKEDVANIFGVTPRTVENWIEHEGLPAPVLIGNRVYWHPEVFYRWLDERLRAKPPEFVADTATGASQTRLACAKSERSKVRSRNLARVAAIEGH